MKSVTYSKLINDLKTNTEYVIDPVAGKVTSYVRRILGMPLGTYSKATKCYIVRIHGNTYYLQDVIAVSAGWDIENKKIGFKDGDPRNCKLENLYIK